MTMTDPIADMLTRIRNGSRAKSEYIDIPRSRLKLEIIRVLKSEGFIEDFKIMDVGSMGFLRIFLKYTKEGEAVVQGLKRVSTPGRRAYVGSDGIPRPFKGMGVAILSTTKGVMTGRQARTEGLGGEVLCTIW